MFTVRGIGNGHYVQLCYTLLADDKTTRSYEHSLDKLAEICPFTLTEAVVDFKKAIHSALVGKLPNLRVVGCRFHLREA